MPDRFVDDGPLVVILKPPKKVAKKAAEPKKNQPRALRIVDEDGDVRILIRHGDHDQSEHGNWASGGGGSSPLTGQAALDAAPITLGYSTETGYTPSPDLTDAENAALADYGGSTFVPINDSLRGLPERIEPYPRMDRDIENITSAIDKSPLQSDVEVWRGVNFSDPNDENYVGATEESFFQGDPDRDLAGFQWTDGAFQSTSVERTSAEAFGDRFLLRMTVPAGTPAIALSGPESASEMLLQRGLTMRVVEDLGTTGRESDAYSTRLLAVEVVNASTSRCLMRGVLRIVDEHGDVRIILRHGDHDQSEHGNWATGGGGGPRESLRAASTTAEVASAAAAEAKAITGEDIEFDFGSQHPQTAREHSEAILRGFEKYPDAPVTAVRQGAGSELEAEATATGAFAMTDTDSGTIYFTDYGQSRGDGAYRGALAQAEANGDLVAGTPEGVAMHEFGHTIASPYYARETAKDMASDANVPLDDFVAESISNYATESDAELAAEAFADVMVNGSGSSALSKAIVNEIDSAAGITMKP